MRFRMLPAAAALAAALLLAGCAPSDPIITPEPVPDSTPVFASDEEALAAATEAYGKYLAVSDEITADGGEGGDRIAKYVTAEQLPIELAEFKEFSEPGLSSSGTTSADTFTLQKYADGNDGTASVVVYVCLDVTDVRILDKSGADVTRESRPNRFPLEVEFAVDMNPTLELLIERSEPWSGNDFC